jgi:hypothetical protein
MAAPGAPTAVSVSGNGIVVHVAWTPADATETHFEIELSVDNGSSWGAVQYSPAGVTRFAVCDPTQGVTWKARVAAVNADGSSAKTTSSGLAVAATAEATGGTDIYLIIGDQAPGGGYCLNVSSLTAAGASSIANSTDISAITAAVVDSPRWRWANRNASPLAIPLTTAAALAWNHVGLQPSISTITPNSPIAGQTAITLAAAHGRPTGMQFRTRVTASGTSLDGVQVTAEVTGATTVKLIGIVASASATTGKLDLPSVDAYDETQRGHVDWRESGSAYPSNVFGVESAILARAQDDRGLFGDETDRTSIALKISGPYSLVSRIVGTASSVKRWAPTYTGSNGKFVELEAQMADLATFLENLGTVTGPQPWNIRGILMSHGFNEIASDFTQLRTTLNVASISVVSGLARIVTSTAHGLTNPASKFYAVGVASGIGGTMNTLNGVHRPLNVIDSTTLEVLDWDATGLSATVTSGTTQIEVGAPLYFFADLLEAQVAAVREAAIEAFESTQEPEDIPTVLWEPCQDPYYVQLQELLGSSTQAITTLIYQLLRTACRSVAGTGTNVGSMRTDDIAHRDNAVVLTSELFYGREGAIRLGERAYDLFLNPAAGETGASTPCVVAYLLGDSYVCGTTAVLLGQLANPEVVAPATTQANGHGAPIPWALVWNHTTAAVEQALVDHVQFPTFGGLSNMNTNAVFNPGLTGSAGVHIAAFRELRTMFPDHDIVLFPFGINGSTATTHATTTTPGAKISAITPGATTVTITLDSGTAGQTINRTKPLQVTLSGITGLTPDINGPQVATPINVSTNPLSPGTRQFTIAVASVTGTADVSAAYAQVPQSIWDPDAADVWPEFEAQVNAFHVGLHEAGYRPDARAAFVMLGTNDQALDVGTAAYTEAMQRIVEGIRDICTTRAKPRDELAVVCLEPIVHGRTTNSATHIRGYQTALRAALSGDTRATTLNVDENTDRVADPVTISYDRVHPDTAGYVNLGLRLARKLVDVGAWDASPDTTVGGSGSGGAGEVEA